MKKKEKVTEEQTETCDSNLDAIQEEMDEQREDVKEEQNDQPDLKLKEYENIIKILQADFDNYKKRTTKEKDEIYTFANAQIVKDLLPVVDNFERALSSINKEDNGVKHIYDGVDMIYKQFISVLEKNGVKEIEALFQSFDPAFHHGVMQVEDTDYPENTVVEVLQKGYILKDKVIRPSMVKVAK